MKRKKTRKMPAGERRTHFGRAKNGFRHQERIFRLFQRLHTSSEYEGTGIGLAIVKKAASRMHGSARLESKPGEGSTFIVTLPRKQAMT